MKKLLYLSLLALMCIGCNTPYYTPQYTIVPVIVSEVTAPFIEVHYSSPYCIVNYGQPGQNKYTIYDLRKENNNGFTNIVDALNYLSYHGWKLEQVYTKSSGSYGVVTAPNAYQSTVTTMDVSSTCYLLSNDHPATYIEEPAEVVECVKECVKEKVPVSAEQKLDMYYIAYLYKTNLFNKDFDEEVKSLYDMKDINSYVTFFTKRELKKMSVGHSADVEKYMLKKK